MFSRLIRHRRIAVGSVSVAAILAATLASAQQTIVGGSELPPVIVQAPRPVSTPRVTPGPRVVANRGARASRSARRAARVSPGRAGALVSPTAPEAAGAAIVQPNQVALSPTGNPVPLEQVASSVTVITSAEMERKQNRTVPQALADVPGLNIVPIGGPGGQTSVFMRGTNSNGVKVLIDGIDVSDPSNPNRSFNFGQLLAHDLARIEVLRGPQSGFYGADALGGVIAITTKKGEGPPKVSVTTEGGSYGTFNQFGTLSGSTDKFNYFFGLGHYRSEAIPVTPPDLVPLGRRINPNFYDNLTFSTKLGYDFNEYLSLNYVGRVIDSTLLFTGDGGFPSTPNEFRSRSDAFFHFHRGEAVVNLLDGRFRNVFGVGYTNEYSTNQNPPVSAIRESPQTRGIGIRTKYDYQGDLQVMDGQRLVFGAQREDESLANKTINPKNGNTGVYLQWQQQYFDRLFLVSNVRYDENDAFGSKTTYRVAPAYILPWTETKLKASVGTGFKAPTLSQLFQDFPSFNFYGNPNLRPEELTGWDAGFEQPLFGDRVRFGATYFDNDIKNLILTGRVGRISTPINIGKAHAYGVETFLTVAFSDRLKTNVTYTNTTTKDEINRQELLRRPRHKLAGTVEWQPLDRLTLAGTALFIGGQVDGDRAFTIPRLRTDAYTIVNLAANYKVTDTLEVFGRVDNLFDKKVEDPTGFLRPGLSAYGGVRVSSW